MIADKVNMNQETVCSILTGELRMRKFCAKMVPRILKEQLWDARISVCPYLLEQAEANPMLVDRVIFGDERWFFQYDPETKCQSSEWRSEGSPRRNKAHISNSKEKCMLVCFFDSMGIVHKEWLVLDRHSLLLHRNSSKTEKEGHAGSSKHCEKLDPS